jgi:hypothetical protein
VPCVGPDGTLTESARSLMEVLAEPQTPEEVSARLEKPIFWVRMSLRELVGAGLASTQSGKYVISEEGKRKL